VIRGRDGPRHGGPCSGQQYSLAFRTASWSRPWVLRAAMSQMSVGLCLLPQGGLRPQPNVARVFRPVSPEKGHGLERPCHGRQDASHQIYTLRLLRPLRASAPLREKEILIPAVAQGVGRTGGLDGRAEAVPYVRAEWGLRTYS
jgi:hypothetical protein